MSSGSVAAVDAVANNGLTMDDAPHTVERVERAADVVRARFSRRPDVAIILGTGLGGLAKAIDVEATVEVLDDAVDTADVEVEA